MPLGVFILDGAGRAIYANSAAHSLLLRGVTSEDRAENLGRRFSAYVAGTNDVYPTEKMPIVRALAGERTQVDDMEVEHGGRRIALEVTGTPILDEQGKVLYAIAVFQDITLRREAQRALASLNEQLEREVEKRTKELREAKLAAERANRAKSVFLMNISHELRTPLNHIIGFSELLSDRIDDPRSRRLAETATSSGRDLLEKVNDLIDLARTEAEPRLAEPTTFDADALLHAVAEQSGVSCHIDEPLGSVRGNAEAMRQILTDVLQRVHDAPGLTASKESAGDTVRLRIRIASPRLCARIRAIAMLFGDASGEGDRYHQQEIDFRLAVARAHARVLGGDVAVSGDAATVVLPITPSR